MGALPKRKYAKARQGRRRMHLKMAEAPQPDVCPQCLNPKLPHHACLTCGTYKGRDVVEIKSPAKKTS